MLRISHNDFDGFINGDNTAFERIFHLYYKTLLSFSMRHDIRKMDAEDIVLEVFHRLWQIRTKIKSSSALHTLLYTSVRNRTINHIRNTTNRQRILEEQHMEQSYEFEELLIEEELGRILDEAISKLSRNNQRVIMAAMEGKSLSQIAEEMNISINSVKTYKLRAIHALRKSLKEYPYLLIVITYIV